MRVLAILGAAVAVAVTATACQEHEPLYHCQVVYEQRVQPYAGHENDSLYRVDRSGNWDFCDFRAPFGTHEHHFYINIHDHTIQGG